QTGLGYEYGLLPFMADMRIPQGNYLIDGTFGLRLKGLPFTGGYYYSGSESVSGLNNHFNIHFDIYAYKQKQKEKFDKLKDEKIKALKRAIVEKENLIRELEEIKNSGQILAQSDQLLHDQSQNVLSDTFNSIPPISIDTNQLSN